MKKLKFMAILGSLFLSSLGNAAVIPSGIATNVNVNTIANNGWSSLYRQNFGVTAPISSVFGGLTNSDWLYMAGIRNIDDMIIAGAAVTWGEFSTYTRLNQTHNSNGASWYYNGYSLGFTSVGDGISQNSADTSFCPNGMCMSVHTNYRQDPDIYGGNTYFQNSAVAPTLFGSGYRVGNVSGLNASTSYDIAFFVLSQQEMGNVPEPATLALMGLGLAGLGFSRRKFPRTQHDTNVTSV